MPAKQIKTSPIWNFFFISWFKEICHLEMCKNSLSLSNLSCSQNILKKFSVKNPQNRAWFRVGSWPTVRQWKTKRSGSARFGNAKGRPGSSEKGKIHFFFSLKRYNSATTSAIIRGIIVIVVRIITIYWTFFYLRALCVHVYFVNFSLRLGETVTSFLA